MAESMTAAVSSYSLDMLTKEIRRTMRRSARDAVQLGYMLRRVMDEKLWVQDYSCFDDYLDRELHMDHTLASRFMGINRKYSLNGNSMEILERYEGYSQGLLIEMLNMPEEVAAKVTPDMTVRQARELKPKKKKPVQAAPAKAEENVIDGEFQEIPEPVHDAKWFVGQYIEKEPEKLKELMRICREGQNHSDMAKAVQKYMAPYEYNAVGCAEYEFVFNSFSGGIDMRIGEERIHLKYGRFVQELTSLCDPFSEEYTEEKETGEESIATSQPLDESTDVPLESTESGFECDGCCFDQKGGCAYPGTPDDYCVLGDKKIATSQPEELSPYGLARSVYPEDSLIASKGCGNKYVCWSCAMDCVIRQEDRYCRTAPLGAPFPCQIMEALEEIRNDMGDRCQFVDYGKAYHTAGSHEADPCCKECTEACRYRCSRSSGPVLEEEVWDDAEKDPAAAETLIVPTPQSILREEQEKLEQWVKAFEGEKEPPVFIEKQKIIVAALAAMVCDLEEEQLKQELADPEIQAPQPEIQAPQPELPELKNNDQRKAWLEDFRAWGLWYRDYAIDVEYYKYDFADGSRLIATVYPQRESYWTDEPRDEIRYHFLEKGRKKYGSGKTYDEKYRENPNSITELVDWLKKFQKGEK